MDDAQLSFPAKRNLRKIRRHNRVVLVVQKVAGVRHGEGQTQQRGACHRPESFHSQALFPTSETLKQLLRPTAWRAQACTSQHLNLNQAKLVHFCRCLRHTFLFLPLCLEEEREKESSLAAWLLKDQSRYLPALHCSRSQ